MDKGFEEIDDHLTRALTITPKNANKKTPKLFLFRIPKDIDISSLHGTQIELNKINTDQLLPLTSESTTPCSERIALCVENATYSHPFRPVIRDPLTGRSIPGSDFDGFVGIKKVLSFPTISPDSSAIKAYEHVAQKSHLLLHNMPFGATTSLKSLRKKKSSRQSRVSFDETVQIATIDNKIDDDDEDAKRKKKKAKKDKKSKGVTGSALPVDIEEYEACGANKVLIKPVSAALVYCSIEECKRTRRA